MLTYHTLSSHFRLYRRTRSRSSLIWETTKRSRYWHWHNSASWRMDLSLLKSLFSYSEKRRMSQHWSWGSQLMDTLLLERTRFFIRDKLKDCVKTWQPLVSYLTGQTESWMQSWVPAVHVLFDILFKQKRRIVVTNAWYFEMKLQVVCHFL